MDELIEAMLCFDNQFIPVIIQASNIESFSKSIIDNIKLDGFMNVNGVHFNPSKIIGFYFRKLQPSVAESQRMASEALKKMMDESTKGDGWKGE